MRGLIFTVIALWIALAGAAMPQGAPDVDAFGRFASSVETSIENGRLPDSGFEGLRDTLQDWREKFSAAQSVNGVQIQAMRAQIEALGPVPAEGESEPAAVAERRAELNAELQELMAPRIAAEESTRMHGELQALDISPRAKGYRGMWKRVPIGPCSFISPFNFPLNLAAHKVAPAIAVGCPFVMKPASKTPLGAIIMGEVLAETDLPKGAFSILPCSRDGADLFTVDERLKLLSFTGSPGVGWDLKARCGKKKIVLELGGNAAVVVDKDTDLDDAVARITFGAFYQSGQSCIGVQRILIHEDIYPQMREKLVAKVKTLIAGDPKDENTFIGPMISESEAKRLHDWIIEAHSNGADVLCGGNRDGAMLDATLMENVGPGEKVNVEEAFGPLAILIPFVSWDEALQIVNDSKYGLQAGIFTRDFYKIQKAWDTLEVGGVVVGDVPSYRVDNMPYGGVKDSGLGREGIRFAMEDMTEIRNLVIRTPPGV